MAIDTKLKPEKNEQSPKKKNFQSSKHYFSKKLISFEILGFLDL